MFWGFLYYSPKLLYFVLVQLQDFVFVSAVCIHSYLCMRVMGLELQCYFIVPHIVLHFHQYLLAKVERKNNTMYRSWCNICIKRFSSGFHTFYPCDVWIYNSICRDRDHWNIQLWKLKMLYTKTYGRPANSNSGREFNFCVKILPVRMLCYEFSLKKSSLSVVYLQNILWQMWFACWSVQVVIQSYCLIIALIISIEIQLTIQTATNPLSDCPGQLKILLGNQKFIALPE